MKNKGMYRLLSGVLCTSVLLSSQAYAAASADYSDMPQNWSKEAMEFAVKNNFITGVGENKIAPKAALTRAQLAAILSRVMQTGAGDVSVLDNFTDADKNAWYAGAMAKAVELNILYGDGDSIYPDRPVTRQELFTILVRAFSVTGGDESTLASYNDAGSISSWAKAAISAMIAQGYAAGYEDKTLRPAQQVTREEFAQLLHRMREHYSSSDTSEDKTETKTDDTAKTDKTTKTDTKKPSGGGGGGSSSGGGSHGGGTVTANKIVDETQAKVQTTDMGAWLPLVFANGYDMSKATVTVDGKDVTKALSKVTTDGTIAKLALTGTPKQVVVAANGKTQTITLNGSGAASVYTGTGKYLPDYILTHGAVAVWDYHLTNYDKEGNVRVNPAKTTFSLTEEANAHPYYSPDAELITDESGNISGNVTIMFNYNTDAEKEWFNGIKQLELLQYDETRRPINENLTYTAEKDVTHGSGKVGELTIPIGQDNFRSNGRYYVRVKSTGGDQETTLVPIHVVNYTEPELELKETPISGRNLHFNVKNMVYGITTPIESVTLTDPTGATKELQFSTGYALIGNLFVLYNDVTAENGVNNLPYNGNYTITIHSNGFKTFSRTFNVTGGKDAPAKQAVAVYQSAAYDVVTHATGGSSGGGSSSGGSGGYMVSADLLFQSDLLVNALLLDELKVDCAAAKKVVDHWYNVIPDAVFNQGDTTYYTNTGYLNAVNDAKVNDAAWLPFVEYLAKENAETTLNRPSAVKNVLEDGLLGDIQHRDTYGRLEAPQVTVGEAKEGADVVLTFENADGYMKKISKLYLNGTWKELSEDAYEISDNTITIKAGALKIGENKIVIDADGYMSNVISIDYTKKTEKDLSLSVATSISEGEDVVITVENSEGDFLKNLKGVVLKDSEGKEKTVYKQLYEGSDAVYYTVNEGNTIITLKNVKAGTYTVSLTANYYDALATETFTVERTTPLAKAPTVAKHEKKDKDKNSSFEKVDYYRLTFSGMNTSELDAYLNAVTKVTVGNTVYEKETETGIFFGENNYRVKTVDDTQSSLKDCLDLAANGIDATNGTTITVEATGYETRTYTLKDGSTPVKPEPDTPKTKDAPQVAVVAHKEKGTIDDVGRYRLTFKGMSADEVNSYLLAITDVTVGQNTYTQSSAFFEADKYNIGRSGYSGYDYLDLADNAFDKNGKTTVTIKADGYQNLTFEYDAANPIKAAAPEVAEVAKKDDTAYRMTFKDSMSAVELKAYLNAISSVTVGDKDYKAAVYSLSKNKYLLVDSSNTYGSNYDCIDFYANEGFAESGTTTITLKADGYADLQFTYTPASSGGSGGGTTDPDEGKLDAPAYTIDEKTEYGATGNYPYYKVTFTGDNTSEYVNKITSVMVQGTEYSLASGTEVGEESTSYMKETGWEKCLKLGTGSFVTNGKTTVTIEATGYKALVINYGTDTTPPTEPGSPETPDNGGITVKECKLKQDSNGKFYEMRFNGFDNEDDLASFVNSITEVQVGNDKKFTKATFSFSFSETEFGTVTENYSVGIKFNESSLADVKDGTTITIKGKVNGKDVTITYSLVKE